MMNEDRVKDFQDKVKQFTEKSYTFDLFMMMEHAYRTGRDDLRKEIQQQFEALKLLGIVEKEDKNE